jgi:hypothetical protein
VSYSRKVAVCPIALILTCISDKVSPFSSFLTGFALDAREDFPSIFMPTTSVQIINPKIKTDKMRFTEFLLLKIIDISLFTPYLLYMEYPGFM